MITKAQIEDIYPLSPMQSGLLFRALFDAADRAYFLQITLRFLGELRDDSFADSWRFLSRRHAILRTAFVHEDVARPVQVVLKDREPEMASIDIRHLDTRARDAHIDAYREADRARGFDLQREPLVRLALFRVGDREHHLVWSYHHLLLDGWCLGILQQEFLDAYAAYSRGEQPALPAAPQYRDYIRWLATQDDEKARAYWKAYLAGSDQRVSVPRLPSPHTDLFRQEIIVWPEALSAGISALAVRCGVTINTVLQCAWGLLLARSNDADDVVFGAIVSGRPAQLRGVERMVGLFINAVPVRVRLDDGQSVTEWLKHAQREALESEAFHYLPLAEIQAQGAAGRDAFDHLLVFENYPFDGESGGGGAGTMAGFAVEILQVHDRTHYDLDVTVTPGREMVVALGYNAKAFPPDQILRLAAQWRTVLESLVARPDARVGDVEMVPAEERQRVLQDFNTPPQAYPDGDTVLGMFAEQVARSSDSIAVVSGDRQLTYGELERRSNQVARYLRARGVGPETLVGLCLERSLELIVTVWGVLKAGGAYVPLDPEYPAERLAFMASDAGLVLLVTDRRGGTPPVAGAATLQIDEAWERIAREDDRGVTDPPGPRQLAYVIYTSGSTGQPKGVMVDHKNLAHAARAWRQAYELDRFPVRSLQVASFSFDVFAGDLIRALTNGGQLVLCPADVRLEPQALYELIARHRINIFESTPGIVLPLMEYVAAEGLPIDSLRWLIVGSDVLPSASYAALVDRFGGQMRIVNSYGVTEATIDSSFFERPAVDHAMGASTPIGRPLPNVRYAVLDRARRVAPIGGYGELYIGGDGVARGYLRRPSLTDERFLTHPSLPGERLYKTGDVVRWLPSGDVEFIGRSDDQVKLRGYRIELGDVENTLLGHPSVRQAVVLARDENLVAYAVAPSSDVAELRAYLEGRLPGYMVPSHVVLLDAMPLTVNGKIDRGALRDQARFSERRRTVYAAPLTPLEMSLAQVWSQVLQVEHIGIHDGFFELGGHSLKAMQVVSRLHRDLNLKLNLRELFAAPTIAELAQLLASAGSDTFSAIPVAPRQEHYDLSHAQKRLWLQDQLGESTAYNMPEAVALEVAPDLSALRRALSTLVDRHEALRTAFVAVDGEPRQHVLSGVAVDLVQVDVSAERDPETLAHERVRHEAHRPFDLTSPPLLRALLLKVHDRRHVFLLVMHHIIGDGWSINVLYRELLALYDAYRRGVSNPLKPLRIQYKDFTLWQNARGFAREERYWLERLAGVPERLRLPYDYAPTAGRDIQGRTEQAVLPAETVRELRALAVRKHTSLSSVVLALFELFLFQLTRQEDLCVGVSIANRNHPDLENLIGFFVNILPVRTWLSSQMEFETLLEQIVGAMNEAFEYQDYPFDLLVEKLNPDRSLNRHPIANVIYAFQNFEDIFIDIGLRGGARPAETRGDDASALKAFDVGFETSKFDLTLFVADHGEGLSLSMEYDSGLFRRETIVRYLSTLQRFSERIALQPSER